MCHKCTHNSMPRPYKKWNIRQEKCGNYLRINMIFKGKEDWKGWCLKCTFSNSFYYFLKNQNKHSYKFNSPKKQNFSFWRQKRPDKLWNNFLRSDRKLWMCSCHNQIFQPEPLSNLQNLWWVSSTTFLKKLLMSAKINSLNGVELFHACSYGFSGVTINMLWQRQNF